MPSKRVKPPEGYAEFTAEVAEQLLEMISRGVPVRKACRELKVNHDHAYARRQVDEAYRLRFDAAKESGFEALGEECLDIGDQVAANKDAVAKAKLRIETRLKLLACWTPKFAPKSQLALTDAAGGPVQIRWARAKGEALQDPADGAGDED